MLYGIDKFTNYLDKNRFKSTKERLDIANAVISFDSSFSINELKAKIQENCWPVSNATLYRSISLLIDAGMIKPMTSNQLKNHIFVREEEQTHDFHDKCVKCKNVIPNTDDLDSRLDQGLSAEKNNNFALNKKLCSSCVENTKTDETNQHLTKDLRICLLEDEDMIRFLIEDCLEQRGYETFSYHDPFDFNLDCSCNKDENSVCADLLIVDVQLPNMSGIDFVKKMIEKKCKINKVAFISAHWTVEDLDYAGSIGAAIFHKPFSIFALCEWIHEAHKKVSYDRILTDEFLKRRT